MNRARALLLVVVALAGCAGTPVAEAPKRFKPLPSYAADPFVPINLYLNSGEQPSPALFALIEYAGQQLRDSGAFVRLDQGVQRWPITLQARYRLQEDAAEGDVARRVLGYLTFGLVPVRTSQVHTLTAEVLAEPDSVATLELSVTVQDEMSLYALADPDRVERAAADALLERLLAEIAQRKLIPRWANFKPDSPKKPQPLKPVGTPT